MITLPFSQAEFLQVFAAYNTFVWPLQMMATLLGAGATLLLSRRCAWGNRAIAATLSILWLGMGVGYHWIFFAKINAAAYLFGLLYVAFAAIVFTEGVVRGRMEFAIANDVRGWVGGALILYAIVIYPALGLLVTHPYPETPLFGIAPCPTTIFTLALLLACRYSHPVLLALVPLLWSAVGGSAAILLDVPEDWGLFAAALAWIAGHMAQRSAPLPDSG